MADWTSLLAPGSRKGMGGQNDYIARMLMEQSAEPIQSPFQGLAHMAQAYVAKQRMDAGREQGVKGNQALADILAPGTNATPAGPMEHTQLPQGGGTLDYQTPALPASADPKNAQIAALLNGGIGQESFTTRALDKLGFGKPKDPIKKGKDDQILDPTDYHVLADAAPEKPQVAGGMVRGADGTWAPIPGYAEQQADIRKAGRPQVSLSVSADKSFGSQLGENAGKILDASHSAAAGGIQTINTVAQIRGALDTGKVTAGPGANAIQFFNQIAGGDPQKVVATRQAIQGLAQLTLAGRSSLKGQGQISDYEGKLLAKASSGEIDSMTVGEIKAITDVADRNARISIRLNKTNVDKARKAAPHNSDLVDFYNVDEPAPYAPKPKQSGRFTIEQVP